MGAQRFRRGVVGSKVHAEVRYLVKQPKNNNCKRRTSTRCIRDSDAHARFACDLAMSDNLTGYV